jgi:hypothetical protein
MDEATKNTEAASPVRPLQVGPAVYLISQPTLSTMASIAAVVRKRAAKDTPLGRLVNDPAFKSLPIQAQVEAAREAAKVQALGASTIDGLAMMDEMMTPEVLAFSVWVLARGNHPDLKLEDLTPHITEANASEVYVAFNEASGMNSLEPKN